MVELIIGPGSPRLRLRPATDSDDELFRNIYASTREDELAVTGWTALQKEQFLAQQFAAQDHAYRNHYPGAEFWVIQADELDAGRLYLHQRQRELWIMDLALLPRYRNQGNGTRVLQAVLEAASKAGLTAGIHVEVFNPAQRLYQRLGFKETSRSGIYIRMEC